MNPTSERKHTLERAQTSAESMAESPHSSDGCFSGARMYCTAGQSMQKEGTKGHPNRIAIDPEHRRRWACILPEISAMDGWVGG